MIEHIRNNLQDAYIALEGLLSNDDALSQIETAAAILIESFETDHRVFFVEMVDQCVMQCTLKRSLLAAIECNFILNFKLQKEGEKPCRGDLNSVSMHLSAIL